MADREVNVRVNVAPGQDAMTPALEKQQQAAAAVQRQLQANQATLAQPVPVQPLQGPQTAPLPVQPLQGPAMPVPTRPAQGPQVAPVPAPRTPPQAQPPSQSSNLPTRDQLQGVITGQITGQLQQAIPQNALSGISQVVGAFASLPGPVGLFAAGIGLAVNAVGGLIASLDRVRPSLAELTSEQQSAATLLRRIRGQGAPEAEDIRRLLPASAVQAIEQFQRMGNQQGAMATVQQAGQRARATVQRLEGENLGEVRSEVEGELLRQLARYRSGETNLTFSTAAGTARANLANRLGQGVGGNQNWFQAIQGIQGNAGPGGIEIPEEYRNLNFATATPAQLRQMAAAMTTGRLTQAQATVAATTAIGREGTVANLRPGAIQLSELQTLAPARSGDVLDVQSQLQAETFRDQREQARFEAQMSLWERWYEEQRQANQNAAGMGAGGAAGGFNNAMQQFSNQLGALFGGLGGQQQGGGGGGFLAGLPGWFQGIFGPG